MTPRTTHEDRYQLVPFPPARRLTTDIGRLARDKPVVRGLLELDVTEPRQRIEAFKRKTGEALSFTAFLVAATGRAVEGHKAVHACRNWRGQLAVFDEVDIAAMIEVKRGDEAFPVGHIVRGANRKTVREIHDEIRSVQANPLAERNTKRLLAFARLPGFVRRPLLAALEKSPRFVKRVKGTVVLTSVGMFGGGGGWALALPTHSLGVTVGGIVAKPAVVGDAIRPREFLHVTLDFDHDIIDGAPAARFAKELAALVESGAGLPDARAD
jgi:pyruvate/2-oxoglutarate dehydrogenase complex dihydrolipoamide acyltransferase (E2) component